MTEANRKLKNLIEEFCRGGDETFWQIYTDYKNFVFNLIIKKGVPDKDVEDVGQVVWLRFYKSACSHILGAENPVPYLGKMVENACNTYFQQKRTVLSEFDEETTQLGNNNLQDKLNAALDAERVVEQINQLPTQQRQAVILKHKENRTYEEISQEMGVSLENAKQLVHRGKKKIRDFFNRRRT